MSNKRNLILAKSVLIVGALPLLIWAYEYGPNAGYAGVPREGGTCATAGCHTGTANSPANRGSVTVAFPSPSDAPLTYLPGVRQHLSVTIADPATTQRAWGFQLTARSADNPATMAGTLQSTDANTLLMCAGSNLAAQQDVSYSATRAQSCPASMPLQYIEHSMIGYTASSNKTGSFTYEFDWTPPATSSGNITIYVAGNAANGRLDTDGDHIYSTTFTLSPCAGGTRATVTGVASAAGIQPGAVPISYVSIYGTNLANTTANWNSSIVNGKLPAAVGCSGVSIGGKPAYVYFVSPGQINVQAPDVSAGPVDVQVTNGGGTSAAFSSTSQQFAPAFFQWAVKYAIATRVDFSLAVKAGSFPGVTTAAAKPGEVLILWGTGFGPANPAVPAGIQTPTDKTYFTASDVTVTINNVPAQVFGAALAGGFAGLYQIAVQVPASLADGDWPIKASVGGAQSPDNVFLTVQH